MVKTNLNYFRLEHWNSKLNPLLYLIKILWTINCY